MLGGRQRLERDGCRGSGRLLADVNGQRRPVPASNQKLVSTGFASPSISSGLLPAEHQALADYRMAPATPLVRATPTLAYPSCSAIAKLALDGRLARQAQGPVRRSSPRKPARPGASWLAPRADRAFAYGARDHPPVGDYQSNAIEMAVGQSARPACSGCWPIELTRKVARPTQLACPGPKPLPEDLSCCKCGAIGADAQPGSAWPIFRESTTSPPRCSYAQAGAAGTSQSHATRQPVARASRACRCRGSF